MTQLSALTAIKKVRTCSECGGTKTVRHKGSSHENWYRTGEGWHCNRCYSRLSASPRRLTFKGRRIYQKARPRTGECCLCGKSVKKGEIKRTNMHHIKYDGRRPEANTIEVCVKCHKKIHPRRKKQSNRKGGGQQ